MVVNVLQIKFVKLNIVIAKQAYIGILCATFLSLCTDFDHLNDKVFK
ncbi:hypothetical protein PESP_a1901 [Pseudoalteromonas espejiana DSM 9414]|nr:hypothetical protein PESP_a1901 [Pseudoalteromonas espejiana DSM 9414]